MSARITRHTAKRLKTEEASAINPLINHGSDILICIAPYLSVEELVNLALTNKHFGLSSTGDDQLSLMEDVVRQVIINEQTEYEAAALPKYQDESYLQLYHQHKMLRKPLQFDQLVGKNLQYVVDGEEEEDKTKVFVRPANNSTKTAISSNNIMRAGKHYVEFTADSFPRMTSVGIMRPVKGWGNKLEKGKPVNHLNVTMLKKPFSKELLATRTSDGETVM